MFISSVLNKHRLSSSSTGGMHLNALNGSSDQDGEQTENAFGGLFGVSLCDNHPYRPQDSGRSFIESSKQTPSKSASHHKKKLKDAILTDAFSSAHSEGHRQYVYRNDLGLRDGELCLSPMSLRRHSLNIDTDRISTHAQCGSDLSLSLEDLSTPNCHGLGQGLQTDEEEDNNDADLDFTRLSITQVDIDTTEPSPSHTKHSGHHSGKKNKRSLNTTDMTPSDKAIKILNKIKESKKTDHSRSRHRDNLSATMEKSSRPRSSSRHHVTPRDGHEAPPPSKKEVRHRLHKGLVRHSVD